MALKSANKTIRWLQRIGILALGLTVNEVMVYGYDFVIYPYLIVTYGLFLGWTYAVIGSIVLCLGTLWFYDVTKQDWLGIETIKLVRDGEAKGRIRKFFQDLANKGDTLTFFFLSLRYDPFITTVYMRRGSGNHVMSARDWKIFWAGIVVSNAWWGIVVFGAIEIFRKWLAPVISPSILNWFGFN